MALFFLEGSPSCRSLPRYRRLEAVCKALNQKYKIPRGDADQVYQFVSEKLRAENIPITLVQFNSDAYALRGAYLWLTASSPEEQDKIYNINKKARKIIECFQRDGILRWTDLKLDEKASQPFPSVAISESHLPRLEKFEAGKRLAQAMSELTFQLEAVLEENEKMKGEVEAHRQCLKRAADDEEYIKFLEEEITSLEARLRELSERLRRAHSDSLEEIAAQHPELPQLTFLAEELKSGLRKREQEVEKLRSSLPNSFSWKIERGRVAYEERFLDLFGDLKFTEQEHVRKQIEILCSEGPSYPSLSTRKQEVRIPYTPQGGFASRGSDDLRFTWSKQGNLITIHWLFRKGNSRVKYSEA